MQALKSNLVSNPMMDLLENIQAASSTSKKNFEDICVNFGKGYSETSLDHILRKFGPLTCELSLLVKPELEERIRTRIIDYCKLCDLDLERLLNRQLSNEVIFKSLVLLS